MNETDQGVAEHIEAPPEPEKTQTAAPEAPAAVFDTPAPAAAAPIPVEDHPEVQAPVSPHPTPAPANLSNDGTIAITLPHLFAVHPESGAMVADTIQITVIAIRHGKSQLLTIATLTGKTDAPYTREFPFRMPD